MHMTDCLIPPFCSSSTAMKIIGSTSVQWIASFACCTLLAACHHTPSSHEYLEFAKRDLASKEEASAIVQLKNALQQDPGNALAHDLLGQTYLHSGDLAIAENELQKAMLSGFDPVQGMRQLGQVFYLRGELQKILDSVKPDPKMKPADQAHFIALRGEAYLGLYQTETARLTLDEAKKINPSSQELLRGLARLAAADGKTDLAMNFVNQALVQDPQNPDNWVLRGDIAQAMSDKESAISHYQQALELDSNNTPAQVDLVSLYIASQRLQESEKSISTYERHYPQSPMLHYMKGLSLNASHQYKEAATEALTALNRLPDYMPFILLLGSASYQMGDLPEARKAYARFLEAYPHNNSARLMLATISLRLKQPVETLQTLAPFMVDTGHPAPYVYEMAAAAFMQNGDYDNAALYLSKATSRDPGNADLRAKLGLTRLYDGETGQAVADLEAAIKLDPARLDAENELALLYLGQKNYDQALRHIKILLKKSPGNPDFHNLQGVAFVGMNNLPQATQSFNEALRINPRFVPARINLAELDLKSGQIVAAKNKLTGILEQDPTNLQASLLLAKLAKSAGHDDEWESWIQKALKSHPSALQARTELARYFLQHHQFSRAIEVAKGGVTADPGNPMALDLQGQIQTALGQQEAAVSTYKTLVSLVPRSPFAHYRLAMVLLANHMPVAAEASLEHALELKADDADALNQLCELHIANGKLNTAMRLARDYQAWFPGDFHGFVLQGDVFAAQKQYDKATLAYAHAQSLQESSATEIKWNATLRAKGDNKQADLRLREWINRHPDDNDAHYYLADVFMKEGQLDTAINEYQIILLHHSDDTRALNNLAMLYQKKHDPRSLDMARKAHDLNPDSPEILDTLGWILIKRGDPATAEPLLAQATHLSPADPDILYHHAVALLKSGKKQEGKEEANKALASDRPFEERNAAQALLNEP